jgi:hypothetical protein
MAKHTKLIFALGLLFAFFNVRGVQDLCLRVDMKPLLTIEQVRMADMADFLCGIAGLNNAPSWPSPQEIANMDPVEYYRMEVKLLADNGFPPVFMDMEPDRLVNRRFFNQLMFQIALETDEGVRADCAGASSETEQVDCLTRHDWVYSQANRIYRQEILSVLCEREREFHALVPSTSFVTIPITPAQVGADMGEGIIETPATPF